MRSIIVVGMQWGDEGKGKMVDLLAEKASHVVRSQGGNNAGHTVMVGDSEYRFHLVPSGILYPHTRCYIGGGTVIDPGALLQEIEQLEKQHVVVKNRLFLSPYAHLIFPYHRTLDKLYEQQKGKAAIGTTGRGIGPCYADAALRVGIRVCELLNEKVFKEKLSFALSFKNLEIEKVFKERPFVLEEIFEEYLSFARRLKPFVANVEYLIAEALEKGEPTLFEGAHGTFLDATFGTYPFVTSSHTIAAGVGGGVGVGPSRIDHTLGVLKAYTTRVGNGPLPTALNAEEEKLFLSPEEAREIGTTTGRKRRMGWFDGVLARQSVRLNGVDSLAVTKLDVLDRLPFLKICTGYLLNGERQHLLPPLAEDLSQIEPLYETLPGWQTSTQDVRKREDLPSSARAYLQRIEEICGVPISAFSVGPERERTLFLNGCKLCFEIK